MCQCGCINGVDVHIIKGARGAAAWQDDRGAAEAVDGQPTMPKGAEMEVEAATKPGLIFALDAG
jgi:hypothetical protein